MPLNPNKSKEALGKNIAELIGSFKTKGKIGTSKPKNKERARKQALAIAFNMKGGQ